MTAIDQPNGIAISARIGVVLVNWNTLDLTCACIVALETSTLKPSCIVVVDNASQSEAVNLIAVQFPAVHLIKNKKNLGFAGGNNVGVRALLTAGCEYIWILNNDTIPAPDCLQQLLNGLLNDTTVGATTSKILRDSPPNCIWYAGAEVNYWSLNARHRGQGRIDDGRYDQCEDVEFMSGCCMLVRAAVLRDVGLFDEVFFTYSEDFDWCLRANAAGIRLRYIPSALITHCVSASMNKVARKHAQGETSPFVVYITSRNRLFVIRKHARGLKAAVAFSILLPRLAYYGVALALLGRWEKVGALLGGIRDGVRWNITNPSKTSLEPHRLASPPAITPLPNAPRG